MVNRKVKKRAVVQAEVIKGEKCLFRTTSPAFWQNSGKIPHLRHRQQDNVAALYVELVKIRSCEDNKLVEKYSAEAYIIAALMG